MHPKKKATKRAKKKLEEKVADLGCTPKELTGGDEQYVRTLVRDVFEDNRRKAMKARMALAQLEAFASGMLAAIKPLGDVTGREAAQHLAKPVHDLIDEYSR